MRHQAVIGLTFAFSGLAGAAIIYAALFFHPEPIKPTAWELRCRAAGGVPLWFDSKSKTQRCITEIQLP